MDHSHAIHHATKVVVPLSSPIVRGLVAGGTGAVGLAAGLALGFNVVTFSGYSKVSSLTTKQRLALWSANYYSGISAIVPLPILGSFSLIAAAVSASAYQGGRQVGWISAAALASLGHIMFTAAAMLPTNTRLHELNKRPEQLTDAQDKEARTLLSKWIRLHTVRVVSLLTALGLSLRVLAD